MKIGQEQEKILKWVNSLEEEKPISPKDGYKKYCEETGYSSSKETFNNHLLKLEKKGLLEKPDYGKFDISTRGKSKLRHLRNKTGEKWTEEDINKKEELQEFLNEYIEEDFLEAQRKSETLKIKISELERFNIDLVGFLETNFNRFQDLLKEAINDTKTLDTEIETRFIFDVEYFEKQVFQARSGENSGNIVTTEGTIESVSESKTICTSIKFECAECADIILKEQDGDKKKSPYKCDCGSRKFNKVEENYIDSIEFKLSKQEQQNELLTCRYQGKGLSDRVKKLIKPGNKLRASGVLQVEEFSEKKNTIGRPILFVKGMQQKDKMKDLDDFSESKIESVRDKVEHRTDPFTDFAESLAPHILNESEMKKVVSAALFGGSRRRDDGRIHVCVITNPGRGKSDVQEFNGDVFPNTHYADGKQASGVGLTATAEQEKGGRWRLKAGKLVFADKGVLCIDEFDKMKAEDATKLNTAMEKPTFPIDKAGINARLPGEATVIATGNFTEYLEEDSVEYIREYLPEHADSLMDRFSLVYCGVGSNSSEEITESILDSFGEASEDSTRQVFFSEDELLIYRQLARGLDPVLSQVSKEFLMDWLNSQKSISDGKGGSFDKDSKRYLVSLAKLTTMFARSRLSERTNEKDAENAIELIRLCRSSRGLGDGESGISDLKSDSDRRKWSLVREKLEDLLDRRDDSVSVDDVADELPDSIDGDTVERLLEENGEPEFYEPADSPGEVAKL